MKNWKSLMRNGILAAAGLGYALGLQAADEANWYVGAGIGRSDAKRTTSWGTTADATLFVNGITGSTLVESHDTAWKLFGGYQFNANLALEAGYTDLGKFRGTTTITAPAAGLATGKWKAISPLNLAVVGTYPVKDRLSVMGKLGLAVTKVTVSITPPAAASLAATRVQPLLGVGLKYDFTKAFAVRAEFERFNNVGDGSNTGQTPINVWFLSGQYRF
jgi:OOP family OmpA-OmpF porin